MQQLGLPAQLLFPPRKLLLGALIDCGGLLLGGGDPRLGLLSGRALGLLGLRESLRANPSSLGQIGLEPLGRLAVVLGCLGQQGSGLLLRIVIGGLELQNRLLPLDSQLGSRFGGFALNRAPQIFGVKVGILTGGLCLVISLAPNRL